MILLPLFLLVSLLLIGGDAIASELARRITYRLRMIPQTLENMTSYADLRTESYSHLRKKG